MRISTGKSRKDLHWKTVDVSWEQLLTRLEKPTVTQETMREYKSMTKDAKSDRKDVGGFVGGVLKDGRRLSRNVESRSLVTLDADFATDSLWDTLQYLCDYRACMYSTHSHQPSAPRYRIVIPLDREVTPDEYEPIARRVAADLGIDQFDATTYEPSRLMYWPSVPRDAEYVFKKKAGGFLSADATLARYDDWHDITEWPLGSSESTIRAKQTKAQGDPETKAGMVGLFCRAYDVPAAIEAFLSDVYTPCSDPGRYTYTGGSTSGGLVLYDDGKFAFSHHATDPAGGQLCNAYDLVRLHKFKDLDADTNLEETPIKKWPSVIAMNQFAEEDKGVRELLYTEKIESAREAFSSVEDADVEWAKELTMKNGAYESTTRNVVLILENDSNLAGKLAMNLFTNRLSILHDLPWRKVKDKVNGDIWDDVDDSALRYYIETTYGITNSSKIADALNVVMLQHGFHPVRNYLNALKWDGVERAEKIFVDFMGAECTAYTKCVTRKWLAAAVARIMNPGCKFDNMIVLVGDQGVGKSFLASKLGKYWFSDTFSTVQGKEAYEQLKGCWIIEMGELAALKRSEVEAVKMFISKQEDTYRGAFQRHVAAYKRQCVFYGSTNDREFLKDRTGNRRFWPIGVDPSIAKMGVFNLTGEYVDQIWAEAVTWYKAGEPLYLPKKIAAAAVEMQEQYRDIDPREGQIAEYLDRDLPENWETLTKSDRRNYIQGYLPLDPNTKTFKRQYVSVVEIMYELFGIEPTKAWEGREYASLLGAVRGWKKTNNQRTSIYGRQFVYKREEDDDDSGT